MKIQMYVPVAVFLLLRQIQALHLENMDTIKCYADFCNMEEYCDHVFQQCQDCSTRFQDCYTPKQDVNCTFFCIKYQPCPPLKPLLHGHHNGSDGQEYMYGSKVKFTCEDGYQNIGVTKTLCQYFGKWSHLELSVKQPSCKENKCMIPRPPAKGRIEFSPNTTEFVVGSQISFKCDDNYNLQGKDSNWTCLANGTWNGTLPECEFSISLWATVIIVYGSPVIIIVGLLIYFYRRFKKCTGNEKIKTPKDCNSLKEQAKASSSTPESSQVVNKFYNSKVKCVIGENNVVLNKKKIIHNAETGSIDSEESNESADIVVTTDAVIETRQNDTQDAPPRPDLPMNSLDHNKIAESRLETAVSVPDCTENDGHLILE